MDPKKICLHFFFRTFPSESPSNLRKALHDDKASTSHCVAGSNKWHRGAPEDRNLQVGGSFADLGFLVWIWQKRGVDFYKLNVYLLKSSKISKICWFILKRKFQSSSFIQSYIPPPKKKKLVLIPMLYLVTWVTWATQPLGSSPSTVKVPFQVSRPPLHREKHRPHYFKLGSLHSGSNPNTLWTKPGNHRNTFTKHSLFCQENFIEYHLVKVLEGCSHSWDSKCSQHVTYYSKTWYFLPYLIASSVIRKTQHSNHHRRPFGQSSFLMLSKASNSSANSPGDLNLLQRTGLCRDNSCIIFSGKTRASAHMYLEESVAQIVGRKGFEMHGWTQQWLHTWHMW